LPTPFPGASLGGSGRELGTPSEDLRAPAQVLSHEPQRFRCGQTRLSGSGSFTIPKWVLLREDEVIE
jgi:hypothetical protein